MSKTIDERVVSMQFDNKQFKKGVAETIEALDQFEKSLNMDGAGKGIDNLSKAMANVDASPLTKSAEAIKTSFSLSSMVAISAINNIVSAAVNAGAKITKALTIEPITDGFKEYELKMGSVQTIMASTGASIDEVNGYLEALNKYSDRTIYSFADMTNNIGKFTNAGVKLDDAVAAIQGISNEAALAGANANEASRAMYNFAQALSSGSVRLIDWKSIENANMATVDFKQNLIDTAEELGVLVKQGDKWVSTTTDLNGKISDAFNATLGFNDSLSHQWMTTDVLIKTLRKYTDETTDLGKRAFSAAQDIKTFSQMMDTLKEAVGSGWATTFEIMFGDFEEAKKLWTEVGGAISSVIDDISTARNDLLRGGLATGMKQVTAAGIQNFDALKEAITDTYGTAKYEAMMAAGGFDTFEESLTSGWVTADVLGGAIDKMANDIQTLSDAELRNKGYTEDNVKAFGEFVQSVKSGQVSIADLSKVLSRQSGRENIIDGLRNSVEALMSVIKPVAAAFYSIFPKNTSEKIYQTTQSFKTLTEQLKLSSEAGQTLYTVVRILLTPFRLIWISVRTGAQVLGTAALLVWKLTDAVLALFQGAGPLPGALKAAFGDERYYRAARALATIIGELKSAFDDIKMAVTGFVGAAGELNVVNALFQTLGSILAFIGNGVIDVVVFALETIANLKFSNITHFLVGGLMQIGKFFREMASAANVMDLFQKFLEFFKTSFGDLPGPVEIVIKVFTTLGAVLTALVTGLAQFINHVGTARIIVIAFGTSLVLVATGIIKLLNNVDTALTTFTGVGKSAKKVLDTLTGNMKMSKYKDMAVLIGMVTASIFVLSRIPWPSLLISLGALVGSLAALLLVVDKLGDYMKENKDLAKNMKALGMMMLEIAGAAGILSIALAILVKSFSEVTVGPVLGAITVLGLMIAALLGVVYAFKKMEIKELAKGVGFMIAYSAMLLSLAKSLQMLAKINLDGIGPNLAAMIAILGMFTLISYASKGVQKGAIKLKAFATGVLMLTGTLIILSKIKGQTLTKGILAFIPVFAALAAMMWSTSLAGRYADKAGKAVLSISAGMILLTAAIKMIAAVPGGDIIKAGLVVSALGLVLTLMVAVMQDTGANADKLGKMFMSLGAAMIGLALAVDIVGQLDTAQALKGVLGISALIMVVAGFAHLTSGVEKGTIAVAALVGAVGVLSVALALLSMIPDDMSQAIIGLSATLLSLGYFAKQLANIKITSAIAGVGLMIGFTFSMIQLAGAIKQLQPGQFIEACVGLGLVLLSLSGAMKLMPSEDELQDAQSKIGFLVEFLLAGEIAIGLLSMMPGDNSILAKAAGLSLVMVALSQAMSTLGEIDSEIQFDTKFFLTLAAILGGTGVVIAILSQFDTSAVLQGAKNASYLAAAAGIFTALGALVGYLSKFGEDIDLGAAAAAVAKMELLAAEVLLPIGVVALAIGALASQFDGALEKNIDKGFEVIQKIAFGLGGIVGALVSGVGAGLLLGLPVIGDAIGQFGTNIQPFFDALNSLNAGNALKAATAMAESLLALTVVGVIAPLGVAKALLAIGTALEAFGPQFVSFAEKVGTLPDNTIQAVKVVSECIKALTANVPESGGLLQMLFGEKDLSKFGEQLEAFADGFVRMSNKFSQASPAIDFKLVEKVTASAMSLAGLANALPSTGGTLSEWFFGEKDLAKFGQQLELFATHFVSFNQILTSGGKIDTDTIKTVTSLGMSLAGLANALPSTDGTIGTWFFGEKDLAGFGDDLILFGQGFAGFYAAIKDLDVNADTVTAVTDAALSIASLELNLPDEPNAIEKFFGAIDMGEFGQQLTDFGTGIATFYGAMSQVQNGADVYLQVDTFIKTIKAMLSTFKTENLTNLSTFANIGEQLASFANGMQKFYETMVNMDFNGFNPETEMFDNGFNIGQALLDGLKSVQMDVTTVTQGLIAGVVDAFTKDVTFSTAIKSFANIAINTFKGEFEMMDSDTPSPLFARIGTACIDGLINGLDAAAESLYNKVFEIGTEMSNTMADSVGVASPSKVFYDIGSYCIQGLENGMMERTNSALTGVVNFCKSIFNGIRNFFGINSPSTLMRDEVGRYIIEGLADGITEDMSAEEAAEQKAQNIMNAFQDELDRHSLNINTIDLESQLAQAMGYEVDDDEYTQKKMEQQAKRVVLAEAQWKATVDALGEESEQAQNAYNSYLQEQIDLAQLASNLVGETEETQKTQADAFKEYADYLNNYQDALLQQGFSPQEIYDAAMKQSGFTGNWDDGKSAQTTVASLVDQYVSAAKESAGIMGDQIEIVFAEETTEAVEDAMDSVTGGGSGGSSGGGGGGSAGAGGANIASAIGGGFSGALPDVGAEMEENFKGLFGNAGEGADNEGGTGLFGMLGDLFTEGGKKTGENGMLAVIEGWVSNWDKLNESGKEGAAQLINALGEVFGLHLGLDGNAAQSGVQAALKTIEGAQSKEEDLQAEGEAMAGKVETGVNEGHDELYHAGEDTAEAVEEGASDYAKTDQNNDTNPYYKLGGDVVDGFINGIKAFVGRVFRAGADMAEAARIGASTAAEIHSPSRVFYELGMWMDLGLANGIADNAKAAVEETEYVCSCIAEAAEKAMADPAYKPVIEPVYKSGGGGGSKTQTTLYFDAEGNLVPYGAANTGSMFTGSWIETDVESAAQAWSDAADMFKRWENGEQSSPWQDEGGGFSSSLLQDLYEQSQANAGARNKEESGIVQSINYNFTQNNTSPKAISSAEQYRLSKNLLSSTASAGGKANATASSSGASGAVKATSTKR